MATVLVNAGTAVASGRMIGATPSQAEPKQIGFGTGAGTAAVADTTLFSEKDPSGSVSGSRTAGTSSQVTTTVTNDTYQVVGTMTATAVLGVTNAGLFDNATIGSGALFVKGDFSVINLASGDSISFTIKVRFVAG